MKNIQNLCNRLASFRVIPFLIIGIFVLAYSTLSFIKHAHFHTGYDLAIADQAIYNYSRFQEPISTVHAFFDASILQDHIEIIYIIISPIYWVFPSVYVLLFLQVCAITLSSYAVYLLARKYNLQPILRISLMVSYLTFYGIQFALWSDVHSLVFGVSFLAFFIYFLEVKNWRLAIVFFLLCILSKEDMALLTGTIAGIQFLRSRDFRYCYFVAASIGYLLFLFFGYYPYFTRDGYRYAGESGIFSNLSPQLMIDTPEKRSVYLYSFLHFGLLPIFAPLTLLASFVDLSHYFVLGGEKVTSAQGLFLHYRSTISILLMWSTIVAIGKFKKLNNLYCAVYLIICAMIVQYLLHLPLSYLAKKWFWTAPASVESIHTMIEQIPQDSSIATQVNILPHVTHNTHVYTIFPDSIATNSASLCGKSTCHIIKWGGSPQYLLIDLDPAWNTLHLLKNREDFIEALSVLEKKGEIKKISTINTTSLYEIKSK